MNTAETVSTVRNKLGLSTEQLAAMLEVHRTTIARWEKGEKLPPRTAIILLEGWADGSIQPPETVSASP